MTLKQLFSAIFFKKNKFSIYCTHDTLIYTFAQILTGASVLSLHFLLVGAKTRKPYLCVRGGQALADVHSKQGILAQGDVELEELWQAEVKQGPPEHPRRNLLGHAPPDLQAARVYAAVAACPRSWSKGERNCIICDCGLPLSESIDNHHRGLEKINPTALIGPAARSRS